MPEISLLTAARWAHVLAGAAWLGEVIVIVFVLVPAALKMELAARLEFIGRVFPRIFQLASVLAFITLAAGATLNYQLTGWHNLGAYFSSPRGVFIALGGGLGLLLALFHFFVEHRIEPGVKGMAAEVTPREAERIVKVLRILPRVGLSVMLVIFVSMMIGARGF
ncbi:MAG: hypothetical protein KIT07_05270 [Anaerolineales bacterium]|nr:hypothetical protein [Anaerolineales bacterium]